MTPPHGDKPHSRRPTVFTRFVIFYVGAAVLSLLLAPLTGGKSSAGICVVASVVFIHGIIYAYTSKGPKNGH